MKPKQIDWNQHIRAWKKSGLSQSEYCKLHGLASKRFSDQKCKQLGPAKFTGKSRKTKSDFVPIQLLPESHSILDLQITSSGHVNLQLKFNVSKIVHELFR